MMFPVRPDGVSAEEGFLAEGELLHRIHEILHQIEIERMQEEQHQVKVIWKLRSMN